MLIDSNELYVRLQGELAKRGIKPNKMLNDCSINTSFMNDLRIKKTAPSIEKILKISEYLNVSLDYLVLGKEAEQQKIPAHMSEEEVVRGYRLLDDPGKAVVSNVITFVLDKQQGEPEERDNVIEFKDIPYYDSPASAGTGEPLDSVSCEVVELPALEVPPKTDFLVRIKGNSMEPKFNDGDITFVERKETINSGDIGIFTLDGESFCKVLEYKKGKTYLRSLNPEYPPIKVSEGSTLVLLGKVIGKGIL